MLRTFVAILCLGLLTSAARSQDLIQDVNPFCGTDAAGKGFTFPGADAPFGMIQWSPDTGPGTRKGGYSYGDSILYGFSLDHLSGAGCTDAEDFAFTPLTDTTSISPPIARTDLSSAFSHSNETASPGYYSVKLNDGIKIELTTKTRTGFGRFIYPSGSIATMAINAGSNVRGTSSSTVQIDTAKDAISGSATGGHFCGSSEVGTIYFYAVFNRRFASFGTWGDSILLSGQTSGQGKSSGAYVTFDVSKDSTVLVRVSISYVSVANAMANLNAEVPDSMFTSDGFDSVVASAGAIWNSWLSRIEISGGTTQELETFYTAMYHAFLFPSTCSDVNGEYMGYDGKVHTTTNGRVQYANFSGWDIYRSECQFLAMIAPGHASDMAQSLLRDYQQGGAFPRWGVPNEDSGIMEGDPSAAMIADFYAFGARSFDTTAAFAGLYKAATDPSVYAPRTGLYERPGLSEYLKYGYIPESTSHVSGCVSTTLEYVADDFALSRFADALGDSADGQILLKHSQDWRNLFNYSSGYMQIRRADGSWAPGFSPDLQVYDNARGYVEATPAQYVWMVPFDLESLSKMMGGPPIAAARLKMFFTQLNAGYNSVYCYMGNEPCLETPWIFSFLGEPYETQRITRAVVSQLYSPGPLGLPGNDDLGEMSSWYIWAAMGMYPELPGSGVLVFGSPLFPKIVLRLKGGDVVITGNGASQGSPYVTGLNFGGQPWNKTWIRYSQIDKGGSLAFDLSSLPDSAWGSCVSDAPPSYSIAPSPAPSLGLLSPLPGDTLSAGDTTLVWHSVPGVNSYNVIIASDSLFSSISLNLAGVTDTLLDVLEYVHSAVHYPAPPNTLVRDTKYYWRVVSLGNGGAQAFSSIRSFVTPANILGIESDRNGVPLDFRLSQNYPNPFNPSSVITYDIAARGHVTLTIYDVLGRKMETLVDAVRSPGRYEVTFNARNFSSGVYFYTLTEGANRITKKMLLLE